MSAEQSTVTIARVNWPKVLRLHLLPPAILMLGWATFSDLSLAEVFSWENIATTSRWRPIPYMALPMVVLFTVFFFVLPLLHWARRGKLIWIRGSRLHAIYFQSFPVAEIEPQTIRSHSDHMGSGLAFYLRSGGEKSINLNFSDVDGAEVARRLTDAVLNSRSHAG
jgi:hypothetical protein